jgi:hypothetical protein
LFDGDIRLNDGGRERRASQETSGPQYSDRVIFHVVVSRNTELACLKVVNCLNI